MLRDYLIITYLTLISCWPVTLPVVALIAWLAFKTRHYAASIFMMLLLVLFSVAAWQFEHYF